MNESLNRAFIRAYDKEKSSEARRKLEADKQQADELAQLMVQFDTATVQIPAPHMLQAHKRRETAVASQPQPERSVRQVRADVPVPNGTAVRTEEDIRGSIVEQMMQATNWEDQTVATFTSEIRLPQLPQAAVASQPVPQTQQPNAVPASAHELQANVLPQSQATPVEKVEAASAWPHAFAVEHVTEHEKIMPSKPIIPPSSAPALPEQGTAPEDSASTTNENGERASQPEVAVAAVPQVSGAIPKTAAAQTAAAQTTDNEPVEIMAHAPAATRVPSPMNVPELAAPATPALNPGSLGPAETSAATRQEWAGNIFRLDRPSYDRPDYDSKEPSFEPKKSGEVRREPTREQTRAHATNDALAPEYDDGEDDPSEVSDTLLIDRASIGLGQLQRSPQSVAQAAPVVNYFPSRPATRNQHADAEALALEKKLRNAKLRIFNPVWEVDNLQWPPVCLELMHRMSSSFKSVAENLAVACQEGLQVMAVTSPQRGEGTTTVACCLALLAGSHGLNVAIVDGDIEKPSLSYQTNLDVDQDWCGALLHNLSLEEVAIHSIDDQVTVVPLLNPISEQEMASGDQRIINMMQELSASFDLVIVDAGRVDSTRSLIRSLGERGLISAALAVVDHRSSTPDRIEDCLRRIRQAGVQSIGLVENFAA